jgi:hypothetical protein
VVYGGEAELRPNRPVTSHKICSRRCFKRPILGFRGEHASGMLKSSDGESALPWIPSPVLSLLAKILLQKTVFESKQSR